MKRLTQFVTVSSLVLLLSGCSLSFYYSYLDWFISWQLDDYFELSDQQEDFIDDQLPDLIKWHQQEELVRARTELAAFRDALNQDNFEHADTQRFWNWVDSIWPTIADRAMPEITAFLSSMTDEQIKEFRENREEEVAEWREEDAEEDNDPEKKAERREDRIEGIEEQLEDWIGDLNKAQKERIVAWVDDPETSRKSWQPYYRKWENFFFETLINHRKDPLVFKERLHILMIDQSSIRGADLVAQMNKRKEKLKHAVTYLLKQRTEKQTKKITRKLNKYIKQMDKIIQRSKND